MRNRPATTRSLCPPSTRPPESPLSTDFQDRAGFAGRASRPRPRPARAFVVARAHPDHLAYFNPIAGAHPERILVDSNLDWGQDLYRLTDVMKRMRIDEIHVAYFGSADLRAAGVPNARRLEANERATGWIAASQTNLSGEWGGSGYQWLYDYELVGRIGPSLLLFYVPETAALYDTTASVIPAGSAQK